METTVKNWLNSLFFGSHYNDGYSTETSYYKFNSNVEETLLYITDMFNNIEHNDDDDLILFNSDSKSELNRQIFTINVNGRIQFDYLYDIDLDIKNVSVYSLANGGPIRIEWDNSDELFHVYAN